MTSHFDNLLTWILKNRIRVVLVEGPRGSGKTTLCKKLVKNYMTYYKTWGEDQKNQITELQGLGLDLPQGTYFVLDFLSQVSTNRIVVCDRGNLSTLVYQKEFWETKSLQTYYVDLMRRSNACLLYLDVTKEELIKRRTERQDDIDFFTNILQSELLVTKDKNGYDIALDFVIASGLVEDDVFEIDVDALCFCYLPRKEK